MTTKIPQHNGKVVYRITFQPLTVEEQANLTVPQDMLTFRENVEECLGAQFVYAKLNEVGIPDTLDYLPYAEKDLNKMTFPDLDEEITPEVGDENIHASIMLPRGSQMMCSTVKAWKHDLYGNPIGGRSDNPFLDTHLHGIELPDRELTPLTTNMLV